MSVILEAKVGESQHPIGLQDAGHVYLDCSACGALLVDIWSTDPNQDFTWKVRANCPFCGDKSYEKEVKGLFHYGGYGRLAEGSDCDDFASTVIDAIEETNGVFNFKVRKADDGAKPCFRK